MADTPPKKPKIIRQDLPPPRTVAFPGSRGPAAVPAKIPPKAVAKPLVPKATSDPGATTGAITGPFPVPRPVTANAVAVPAPAPAADGAAPPAAQPAKSPASSTPAAPATPAKPVAPMKPVVRAAKRPGKTAVKPVEPTADPVIGRVLARCKIEERIGEGKTSVVYRATHTALGMPVAVKILHPSVLEHPEIVAQFENEARAIAKLDHANILKIFDVATEGDKHCIVMELLEGESVLDLLEDEGRVEPVDALRIVRQAAAGLAAAHAKHIIHRDVKPQNLVILADGTVKLVDFGLATAADSELAASRIGTPHYMSPEVCQAKAASPESDVYSLGVTLYHLLVGAPPYAGMTIKEILEAHVEGKPLHPERRLPNLGKPLCELVRDMTKRDPLTRMSTTDVIAAVDQIGGKELAARPRLKARRAQLARAAARGRAPMLAIVGGAVLVAGLLAFFLMRGGSSPASPGKPGTPSVQGPGGTGPDALPPGTGPTEVPNPPAGTEPETPAVPPPPPPETEDQKKQREKKEAMTKSLLANQDLKFVSDYARTNEQDKAGVVLKYRQIATTWKGTDAGKEAGRRATAIEKGEMPVHPDKAFAPPEKVDVAKVAWDAAKEKIEAAVSGMRYEEALHAVPEALADRGGDLNTEILFWRQLLKDCAAFQESMRRTVDDVKGDARKIVTPKGPGKIVKGTDMGLKVQVGDETLDFAWSQLKPAVLAALAQASFAGKGPELNAQLAAFAFAHRVDEVFYGSVMAVKAADEAGPTLDQANRALERADKRFAPPDPKKPAPPPAMEPAMDEPPKDGTGMDAGMQEPEKDKPDDSKPPDEK